MLLCITITTYAANEKDINNLVKDSKKQVFHTTRPSSIDTHLSTQYKNFAKTDPETYNRLVAYTQKIHGQSISQTQKKQQ